MWNEYLILFEDNDGEILDFTVEAPDHWIARDTAEVLMDLEGVKGSVLEVTRI